MAKENRHEGIISEIRAGMVLVPYNDLDKTWNAACERAIKIAQLSGRSRHISIGTERSNFITDATA